MYCPKCGTQNVEDVKFCRSCGANLSLVPQALSGLLPQEHAADSDSERRRRDRHGRRIHHQPSIARGIQQVFLGLAFLIIAITLWVTNVRWGLWLLIPAFTILGKGFGDIAAAKQSQSVAQPAAGPARTTGEIAPPPDLDRLPQAPPSITENTTRHLDSTKEQRPRETR